MGKINKKHSLEYVISYFKENGCELLEEEYINSKILMNYRCKCLNISRMSFNNFKKGRRCKKCAGLEKYSFTYVKDYFKKHNCELLEKEYKHIDFSMKYKCECKDIKKITFYKFKQGQRCYECSVKRRSGENHWNYNFNLTDEERKNNESRTNDRFYKRWRKKVFVRDGYTCRKCDKKGCCLNSHHIISWVKNVDLRLVVSNGITFCENCHKKFHKIYGKTDNNRSQLNRYLN